jgi:hypothetical protein
MGLQGEMFFILRISFIGTFDLFYKIAQLKGFVTLLKDEIWKKKMGGGVGRLIVRNQLFWWGGGVGLRPVSLIQ